MAVGWASFFFLSGQLPREVIGTGDGKDLLYEVTAAPGPLTLPNTFQSCSQVLSDDSMQAFPWEEVAGVTSAHRAQGLQGCEQLRLHSLRACSACLLWGRRSGRWPGLPACFVACWPDPDWGQRLPVGVGLARDRGAPVTLE